MFPSKEEAIRIAKVNLPDGCKIVRVTDDWSKLNVYNIPPSCWYFIYISGVNGLLQSSSYLAISKVDGSIVDQGSLNDEG